MNFFLVLLGLYKIYEEGYKVFKFFEVEEKEDISNSYFWYSELVKFAHAPEDLNSGNCHCWSFFNV